MMIAGNYFSCLFFVCFIRAKMLNLASQSCVYKKQEVQALS